ncbi:hypothetical protein PHMEG_0003994 [Phytophthora megakarya]|uniref:Uncharacterized protein n=1 Tax=Phytophthora megakarya TaxID=4795 RepID=A0A225WWI4_9STRA|nr:hypothetical protein PHMEG_0003994 [Phytophthora megakarya]
MRVSYNADKTLSKHLLPYSTRLITNGPVHVGSDVEIGVHKLLLIAMDKCVM